MKRFLTMVSAAMLLVAALALPAGADEAEQADILGQGGAGVLVENGASLDRFSNGIRFSYTVPTPASGSYAYPTNDMVPPGATHPEVVPGYPEVFTLWAFIFNYPELCSDGVCDGNDLGDPDSKGGVYLLGGLVADGPSITFRASVNEGQASTAFLPLENAAGAEVHLAMAPHGMALDGDDLRTQLTVSVGNPGFWWPAIFIPE